MHNHNIVHSDLKLKNFLAKKNLSKIVITDFGISKLVKDATKQN